jgi:hypothetical protein
LRPDRRLKMDGGANKMLKWSLDINETKGFRKNRKEKF